METAAIHAVFFDFDGVLTTARTGSITTLRYLASATGLDGARLEDAFRPFNHGLNLGRTTHEAAWPAICARLGTPIDIGPLAGAFASTPLDGGMLDLARAVSPCARVGIITEIFIDNTEANLEVPRAG